MEAIFSFIIGYILLLFVWLIILLVFTGLSYITRKNLTTIPYFINSLISVAVKLYLIGYGLLVLWFLVMNKEWLLLLLALIFGGLIIGFWEMIYDFLLFPFGLLSAYFLTKTDEKLTQPVIDSKAKTISPEEKAARILTKEENTLNLDLDDEGYVLPTIRNEDIFKEISKKYNNDPKKVLDIIGKPYMLYLQSMANDPRNENIYYMTEKGALKGTYRAALINLLNRNYFQKFSKRRKILVIDSFIGEVIKKSLQESGFLVDLEVDGESGLQKLLSKKYDLILLDVILPNLSGHEIIKRYRKSKKNNGKIVVFTNTYTEEFVKQVFNEGVDGCEYKSSLKLKDLVQMIGEYLSGAITKEESEKKALGEIKKSLKI